MLSGGADSAGLGLSRAADAGGDGVAATSRRVSTLSDAGALGAATLGDAVNFSLVAGEALRSRRGGRDGCGVAAFTADRGDAASSGLVVCADVAGVGGVLLADDPVRLAVLEDS